MRPSSCAAAGARPTGPGPRWKEHACPSAPTSWRRRPPAAWRPAAAAAAGSTAAPRASPATTAMCVPWRAFAAGANTLTLIVVGVALLRSPGIAVTAVAADAGRAQAPAPNRRAARARDRTAQAAADRPRVCSGHGLPPQGRGAAAVAAADGADPRDRPAVRPRAPRHSPRRCGRHTAPSAHARRGGVRRRSRERKASAMLLGPNRGRCAGSPATARGGRAGGGAGAAARGAGRGRPGSRSGQGRGRGAEGGGGHGGHGGRGGGGGHGRKSIGPCPGRWGPQRPPNTAHKRGWRRRRGHRGVSHAPLGCARQAGDARTGHRNGRSRRTALVHVGAL